MPKFSDCQAVLQSMHSFLVGMKGMIPVVLVFYPAGTIWGQKRRSQAQNHFEQPCILEVPEYFNITGNSPQEKKRGEGAQEH